MKSEVTVDYVWKNDFVYNLVFEFRYDWKIVGQKQFCILRNKG